MIVSDIKILEGTQIGYQLIFTKDEPKIIKYENYKKVDTINLLNVALLRVIDYDKETDKYEFISTNYKYEKYNIEREHLTLSYDYDHKYNISLNDIELVKRNNETYIKIHVYQEHIYKYCITGRYLIDYLYLKISYPITNEVNNKEN